MLIRGLNSIYLQAPHIQPADTKPFANHHDGEEAMFFPAVEKMTGEPGVMDTNIKQQKRFHDGLEQLQADADDVVAGKEAYDGGQYGDKMAALPKLFNEEGEKATKELGVPATILCFSNIDTQYEGGMWQSWPPAPAPIYADWRRFGAMDRTGKLEHLYAVPEFS
ncbi:hemerythrin HHE cation binding domain-containing protein [Staphylotrichum tortipilum]|uniref:Hemerythrin HHE cation binding domain-containing protein n=1 Tax=Staphylotrichum tortipilum TaxID=2831512 RepID=A0AAN6MAI9_9PEZI|nr:hemerythrin HHE cation binding domain-containing protein [Staphylotrichum longicolle]